MSNRDIMRYKSASLALAAGLAGAFAGTVQAETIISITQTSFDFRNHPICTVQRMNPDVYTALPVDSCALGGQGTYGPDRIAKNTYDAAGQLVQVEQGYGTAAQRVYARYTYSDNGRKRTEKDANNNLTLIDYDGFDRVQKVSYPAATLGAGGANSNDYESWSYDANNNKTAWRQRDGNVISYGYDNLNREVVKDMPVGSSNDVYTNYDGLGQITWKRFASTGGAGVAYYYDGLGRLWYSYDMNGRQVSYSYYADSTRQGLEFPDGQIQYYAYNNTGALNWLGISGGSVAVAPQYNSLGQITSLARTNSAPTSFSYDAQGRLSSMTHDFSGTSSDVTWLFNGRNPAGQITQWSTASMNVDYNENASSTVNKTYDGLNRDAGIAALAGGYDARGNMTSDGSRVYSYDLENRLLTETAPGVNLSLEYDTEGRLYKYTANGAVTSFLYDGVNLIAEYDGGGNITRRYMHGLGADQPLVQFDGSSLTAGSAKYFYVNYQGSIVALANGDGSVIDTYRYSPYGEPQDGTYNENWSGTRFRYTGQVVLPEARLYYYKARVYDPIAGRFLQTDPVGSKDDLNLYAYVGGDPINQSDPSGTEAWLSMIGSDNGGSKHVTIYVPVKFGGDKTTNTEANRKEFISAAETTWSGTFGEYTVNTIVQETTDAPNTVNLNETGGTTTAFARTINFNVNDNISHGVFSLPLMRANMAHEFGHMLGLGDRYSESAVSRINGWIGNTSARRNTIQKGYEHNIMATPWGNVDNRSIAEVTKAWTNHILRYDNVEIQ